MIHEERLLPKTQTAEQSPGGEVVGIGQCRDAMRTEGIEAAGNHGLEYFGGVTFALGLRGQGDTQLQQTLVPRHGVHPAIADQVAGGRFNDAQLRPSAGHAGF